MSDGVRRFRLMGRDISLPPSPEEGVHDGANPYSFSVPQNDQGHPPTATQMTSQPSTSSTTALTNVAADDDVLILSRTTVEEAQNHSRRIAERTLNANAEPEEMSTTSAARGHQRRCGIRRPTAKERASRHSLEIVLPILSSSSVVPPIVPPPPPPKRTFICPICMGPIVEEVTTRCGHIFCNHCIRTAISMDQKCPTCRCKVTNEELTRIYLPTAN